VISNYNAASILGKLAVAIRNFKILNQNQNGKRVSCSKISIYAESRFLK